LILADCTKESTANQSQGEIKYDLFLNRADATSSNLKRSFDDVYDTQPSSAKFQKLPEFNLHPVNNSSAVHPGESPENQNFSSFRTVTREQN
jgi:hypothetical protein